MGQVTGYKPFGQRIEQLLQDNQLTRAEFAARLGTSTAVVGQWIRGERGPTIQTLVSIADAYVVSLDWLCGRKEMPYLSGPGWTKEQEDIINLLVAHFDEVNKAAGIPDLSDPKNWPKD